MKTDRETGACEPRPQGMRNTGVQKRRRPSALKHGVYSALKFLPGEDPEEYGAWLEGLYDEWQPSGFLEEDAVATLCNLLWRKHHLDFFGQVEQAKAKILADANALRMLAIIANHIGEKEGLRKSVGEAISKEPELLGTLWRLEPLLQGSKVWSSLLLGETLQGLPKTMFDKLGVSDEEANAFFAPSMQVTQLAELADIITPERFEKELAVRERLEGMIERALNRLMALKARKRMYGLDPPTKTSPSAPVERVRRVKTRPGAVAGRALPKFAKGNGSQVPKA